MSPAMSHVFPPSDEGVEKFAAYVLVAFLSISLTNTVSIPFPNACSNPRRIPPIPANRSIDFNVSISMSP